MAFSATILNSGDERRRLAKGLLEALRNVPLSACFTSWWIWTLLSFQSELVYPPFSVRNFGGIAIPSYVLLLAVMAVSFIVIAVVFKRTRFVVGSRRYFVLLGIIVASGTLCADVWLCLGGGMARGELSALWAISSILLGVGFSFCYIELNRVSGHLGMVKTLYFSIVSLLWGALATMALLVCPFAVRLAVFSAMPAVFLASYGAYVRGLSDRKYFTWGSQTPLPLPLKFMITSLVQGTALGLYACVASSGFSIGQEAITSAAAYGATLLLLVAATVYLRIDFNRLIYQIGFLMMALGLLFTACMPQANALGVAVQRIGFFFVFVMLGALGSHLIKDRGLPAIWIAACPGLCLYAGIVGGIVVGALIKAADMDAASLNLTLSVVASGILIGALLLSSSDNMRHGWGMVRPSEEGEGERLTEQICRHVQNEYGLSPREGDTLRLLAEGKRRKQIAEILFVSEETVKTHIAGIYRKVGVHSINELDEVLSAARELLRSDAPA